MITLYDLKCPVPGVKTMSPFVIKVRIALNYKKIPHRSVFLELPEFKRRAQELGLPVNDLDGDNPPRHKVPIIHDDATGQSITDSTRILAYLDKTYPDTPSLLPPGTEAAAVAFDDVVNAKMYQAIWPSIGARVVKSLGEKAPGYKGVVEQKLGMTIEEFFSKPDFEEKYLKDAEEGFSYVTNLLKKASLISGEGQDGPFVNGTSMSYADVQTGCILFYVKVCWWSDEQLWKRLLSWDDGRWAKLYDALAPYAVVSDE
ncbi:hypothetical protein NMY22_g16234 [Coprinellus aureogranulatus]|nr:hypothetical protein NMY22_g16234 [Coprinellus aureogranulatus]